jgi:hypothetical protein
MPKKGFQWTDKQKAIADLLWVGISPQAVIEEGHSKKEVWKVQKALEEELKLKRGAKQETKQETNRKLTPILKRGNRKPKRKPNRKPDRKPMRKLPPVSKRKNRKPMPEKVSSGPRNRGRSPTVCGRDSPPGGHWGAA